MTEMILVTEPRCGRCDRAKEVLHHLSAEFELTVTEIDFSSDEGRRLAIEHAIPVAPGLLLDGVLFSCGEVREDRLRMTLASIRPIGDGLPALPPPAPHSDLPEGAPRS
ncbi:glutaredoxin family protein [Glycomyces sp. YM15]|uniref:glutaredoxin family protein n=1 Tax=Glycomyces sp. YM15 TaxID=2800446 RepID=UPI001964A877|nr:glutaredoxin family protein [Glycomyces sp. YM15]